MAYVDVFVAAVPVENKDKYTEMCKDFLPIYKENGALQVIDCWADEVPDGKLTSFPLAVQKQEGEEVAVGIVIWPDKETHKQGMEKAMSDPRMSEERILSIFDGKRVIFGGFEVVSEA